MLLIIIGWLSNKEILEIIQRKIGTEWKKIMDNYILKEFLELSKSLGELIPAELFFTDRERVEELCRKFAKCLDLDIKDETLEDSEARLLQIDSIELQKLHKEVELKIKNALKEASNEAAAKAIRA